MRAVIELHCTDVSCEWVSCLHPRNRNHHVLSVDVEYHELQLVCHCEFSHFDVEDEDAADGSKFLLLRLADLLVDVVDVLDVSM